MIVAGECVEVSAQPPDVSVPLAAMEQELFPFQRVLPEIDPLWPRSIRRAVEYIHAQHAQPLTLADVAEAACLSKYHFSRLFRAATGLTYRQYVTRVRIHHAMRVLEEEPYTSVARVGYACGFGSERSFQVRFKAIVGETPSAYRARVRGGEQ